jgi:hypothetical protein
MARVSLEFDASTRLLPPWQEGVRAASPWIFIRRSGSRSRRGTWARPQDCTYHFRVCDLRLILTSANGAQRGLAQGLCEGWCPN